MKIRFSRHAEIRLKLRKLARRDIELILEHPLSQYYDVVTRNLIALGRVTIDGRSILLSVAFQDIFGEIVVITVHPIRNNQVQNRVLKARWVKI